MIITTRSVKEKKKAALSTGATWYIWRGHFVVFDAGAEVHTHSYEERYFLYFFNYLHLHATVSADGTVP